MGLNKTGQVDLGYSTTRMLFDGMCDSVSVELYDTTQWKQVRINLSVFSFGNGQFSGRFNHDGKRYEMTLTRVGVTSNFTFVRSEPLETNS